MPVNPMFIKSWSAMHEFWYRLTGGLIGGRFGRARMLLLTTTGRKSDRPRTTPLLYLEDGGNLVVIASNGGNPMHPAWWLNLKSDPRAEVQVGRERRTVSAEEAEGEERERLWRAVVDVNSGYEGYQKSTTRRIPVVILRPAA
ncbi:MAG: nitroreductase family deazaflavin-dependent oxidoreductase [Dehalococcoidia bacterium]|nr:nitroreductase family deazaflavin-dependent oxidoreductase [Dehalococcoidia bacterium]